MRPQETLLETIRAALGDAVQRDAGGVRRNDGFALRELLHPRHEVLLRFELLDDCFEDPVGVFYAFEVILEVAGAHPFGDALAHEGGGSGVLHPLEASVDYPVADLGRLEREALLLLFFSQLARGYVEKVYLQTGVGSVGGYRRAHRPRAEDRDPLYPMCQWYLHVRPIALPGLMYSKREPGAPGFVVIAASQE